MRTSLIVFMSISVLELIAVGLEYELGQWIFKPLLMPALVVYFIQEVPRRQRNSLFRYVMLALFFSMGGDIALLFEKAGELSFIIGLASFLIAHICYILAFGTLEKSTIKHKSTVFMAVLIVAYGCFFYSYLFPKLDDFLKIPVGVYATAICLMGLSLIRKKLVLTPSIFWTMFLGVSLFIFSDSCIALNRFAFKIAHAGFVIMITYIIAQYLIVRGAIRILKKEDLFEQ